ncbi:hypothetical protein D3C85_1373130 [compost metagenome]
MESKKVLGNEQVSLVMNAARVEAKKNGWAVSVAVVDDGGHLLALERLDGCAPISAYIATEKARSAALGRRETARYEEMVNGGRVAFVTAPLLTSLEGGIPIEMEGQIIGAVGVSGVKPEQDAQLARAGASVVDHFV